MTIKTTTFEFIKNVHLQNAFLLLILLLFTDLAFIALHTINVLASFIDNPLLSLEKDNGYPEMFQYIKWFWIIILFAYLSIKTRSLTYTAWGFFFIYLFLDDALSIHEVFGGHIASYLTMTPPLGLRPQDIGELAISGIAGVILLSLVLWAYRYGSRAFKKSSLDILLLIVALAFFGVIVDMAHISIKLGWKFDAVLAVIEDGGEMIVASLIVWYVFLLSVRDETVSLYLIDSVYSALIRRSA